METLTDLNKETIEGLQDLVRINIDSAKGFEAAAEKIDSDDLTSLFRTLSAQREKFAQELQEYVELNDDDANDTGSIKGTFHRWWLEIRGKISGGDEYTVLADAEAGEDAIKARYEKVLVDTAGSPLNAVLQQQYAYVKASHDSIRDLRDAAKSD